VLQFSIVQTLPSIESRLAGRTSTAIARAITTSNRSGQSIAPKPVLAWSAPTHRQKKTAGTASSKQHVEVAVRDGIGDLAALSKREQVKTYSHKRLEKLKKHPVPIVRRKLGPALRRFPANGSCIFSCRSPKNEKCTTQPRFR